MAAVTDPVLRRREQVRRLTDIGQRVGYLAFALAIVLFVVGFIIGFTDLVVRLIVVALLGGSLVLAPSIVFAYAVRAADREDAEGTGGLRG